MQIILILRNFAAEFRQALPKEGTNRSLFCLYVPNIQSIMEITERIRLLLEEFYKTQELFSDCYTVDVELKPGQKLFVFADADSNMDFEKCRKISRFLESHIDTQGWLGETYVLEVSSPGIGRPLKFFRQYAKNIGRNVEVTLLDKSKHQGILKAADEQRIVLEQTIKEKEGKKNVSKQIEMPLPFEQIEKTIVKISF